MDKISKGFVGRTVRAVLFMILIIVSCTAKYSYHRFLHCHIQRRHISSIQIWADPIQGAGAADSSLPGK